MFTCKDCIHYAKCYLIEHYRVDEEEICEDFKNKADFVEVVRCEECKYASKCTDGYYACKVDHRLAHDEDDYCSYGERKDV